MTTGWNSETVVVYGKADTMRIRCIPAAVITLVALTLWVHAAAAVAVQESATPKARPSAPATAAEPVQLSSGVEDILKLSRDKVNDDITVAFIQNGDRRFSLTAGDLDDSAAGDATVHVAFGGGFRGRQGRGHIGDCSAPHIDLPEGVDHGTLNAEPVAATLGLLRLAVESAVAGEPEHARCAYLLDGHVCVGALLGH